MKTILFALALVVTSICVSWYAPASTPVNTPDQLAIAKENLIPSFDFIRTHRQGRGATTTWGLVSNTGVSGFVLQRTYEDPYDPYSVWDNVCTMPCNNNRQYKHTDPDLSPGLINYRCVAVDNGGVPLCVSEITTIQIVQH